MNSQQISFFLSICENGSFSKTASDCYVTQPTVSNQISALERELGVVLFERGKRSVRLTQAGKDCQALFQTWRSDMALFREKHHTHRENSSVLRIGILHQVQPPGLSSFIADYHRQHPSTVLRVVGFNPTRSQPPQEALRKDLDLLITLPSPFLSQGEISTRRLIRTSFVLIASAQNPVFRQKTCSPSDFAGETFFVPNANMDPGYQQLIQRFKHNYGLTHIHTEVIPSIDAICLAVSCNLGISILNEFSVQNRPEIVSGPIQESMDLLAAWCDGNKNPALQDFLQALSAYSEL